MMLECLVGFEYRKESYEDNRDPLLDGTIRLQAQAEQTHILLDQHYGIKRYWRYNW